MSKVDDLCRKGASREEIIEALEEELAAKDALLRQAREALQKFTSRESMNDLESFGYAADAILEAIDKELGK